MRVNSTTIKCDNCDYIGTYNYYNDVRIEPKKGCFKSDIRQKYCNTCKTYTKWFMGEVKEPLHWFHGFHYTPEERNEVNEHFNKIGSIPKCLECGSTHLDENPKHSCGGNLYLEPYEDLIYSLGDRIKWMYEYDDLGDVTKREIKW